MQFGLETFDENGRSNNTGFFISSVKFIFLDHDTLNATYQFESKDGMQLKFLYIRTDKVPGKETYKYVSIRLSGNSIVVTPAPKRPTDAYGSLRTGGYLMVYYGV